MQYIYNNRQNLSDDGSALNSKSSNNNRLVFENKFIATKMTQQYFHLIKIGEE